jgi:hypothetical protein
VDNQRAQQARLRRRVGVPTRTLAKGKGKGKGEGEGEGKGREWVGLLPLVDHAGGRLGPPLVDGAGGIVHIQEHAIGAHPRRQPAPPPR